MKYIYDIILNFNELLYDFYEWNKNDCFTHIKKIPIIKINNKDFGKILQYNIQLDNNLFNKIKGKTELYDKKRKKKSYILITNNYNIIALEFNKMGISTNISSFNIEDELDIFEISMKKEKNFNYKILGKRKIIKTTRLEYKNKRKIVNIINNLNIKHDEEKIKYIYFEYFGRKEINCTKALKELKKTIKYENINTDLKNFFKLSANKS